MRAWHYALGVRLAARVADHLFDWAVAVFTAWVRWFWHLGPMAKLAALAGQVVLVYLVISWLRLGPLGPELVRTAALVLVFFAIVSLLFGSGRRVR